MLLTIIEIILLLAANGFFVAAEFAIVKVRRTQIQAASRPGARVRARRSTSSTTSTATSPPASSASRSRA